MEESRDFWINSLDRAASTYLDVLLLDVSATEQPWMSPEEVQKDWNEWSKVLEKLKTNGTIQDIKLIIQLIKQTIPLINSFGTFCPIENISSFFGTADEGEELIGFEESCAISMKIFQTYLRLGLEEEDELISMHFDHMIETICRSQNPEVVEYFMTKLMRCDTIKAIDDIKNFNEELRQWLEEEG